MNPIHINYPSCQQSIEIDTPGGKIFSTFVAVCLAVIALASAVNIALSLKTRS